MPLPQIYTIDKKMNSMAGLSAYTEYENGGPGSGNFGHSGRPGKVGGSGKGSGMSSTSKASDQESVTKKGDESKEKGTKSKTYFDDKSVGMTPLMAEKGEDGKWTVDSMASESDTHDIMEAYGRASKVAELPYNKAFKDADTQTKQAAMQLTQAAKIIQQHTRKMGDHISGLSTDFGQDVHDRALDSVAKLRTGASLAMVQIRDHDSKSYKALRKAQDEIREASNLLASMQPYYLRQHEKQPVDVSDLFKK